MSDTITTRSIWTKWDRAGLWIMLVGSAAVALITLAAGATEIISQLVGGASRLSLAVDQPLPAAASTGSAVLEEGEYSTAEVLVSGLSGGTTALLVVGTVLGTLTSISAALAFTYLAWRLLRRQPFLRSLTTAFLFAGSALVVGGFVSQFVSGFGNWTAIEQLSGGALVDGFWPLSLLIDLGPIGLGFALLVVASAFQYADRLQRETEGLV